MITTDLFEITQSGNFRVLKALDREDGALIIFEAFAYDLGVPSLTTSVNVLVQIEDVNDNAPVFQNLPYTAAIDENSNEGERITSFQVKPSMFLYMFINIYYFSLKAVTLPLFKLAVVVILYVD